jgi:hypothetical protein
MKEDFLPGWMGMWDNQGKRCHDMQTDIVKVHEREALTGLDAKQNKPHEFVDMVFPDGVVSNKNNTISPSPVTDRNTRWYYEQEKVPSVPETLVTNGGFIDMIGSTSDNKTDCGGLTPPAFRLLHLQPEKGDRRRIKAPP